MWNQTERLRTGLPRTNNMIEGWHRGVQASLDAEHPSIWKCISLFKKEEVLAVLQSQQLTAGQPGRREKRDQVAKTNRLLSLYENYEEMPLFQYLRGIGYNFNMNV